MNKSFSGNHGESSVSASLSGDGNSECLEIIVDTSFGGQAMEVDINKAGTEVKLRIYGGSIEVPMTAKYLRRVLKQLRPHVSKWSTKPPKGLGKTDATNP